MIRKILCSFWMWWDDMKDDYYDLDIKRRIISKKQVHKDPLRHPRRPMKWRDYKRSSIPLV